MSRPEIPVRWFLAAGEIAVLVAIALMALLLALGEPPIQPAPVQVHPVQGFSLQQSGADGAALPWGGTTTGTSVRLEVVPLLPAPGLEARLELSREGGDFVTVAGSGLAATAGDLRPARYRWRARLQGRILTPPRAGAFDFSVVPRVPRRLHLTQKGLDGSSLAPGGSSESGALLGADGTALLEVEVKPVGRAFDGTGLLASAGPEASFQGDDGPYHWRAREPSAAWVAFGSGGADFVVFHPEPPPPPPPAKAPEAGTSFSSGGTRDPMPSVVAPAPTLWVLLAPEGLALPAVGLVALAIGLELWRRRRR